MKNNIVLRLENTLFNTNNINNHLPKAKDRAGYIKTSLPNCKMNCVFVDIIDFLRHMHSLKHINVNVVTGFKYEYLCKLLSINDLQFVKLHSSIEGALNDETSALVISSNDNDLQYAMQNGVDCIKYPADTNEIFAAIGVRKTAQPPVEVA